MHLLKRLHQAQVLQKHTKIIEQTGIAEFIHSFTFFPCIQSMRHLCIISPRQLPVESFLHDACFFFSLGDFWLALHAVVPLRFFLSLSLSPLPHNPLDQNVSSAFQMFLTILILYCKISAILRYFKVTKT